MNFIVGLLSIIGYFGIEPAFFENSEHKNHEEIFHQVKIPNNLNLNNKIVKEQNLSVSNEARSDKIVLGYLPYWELGYSFKYLQLIDIVAYFSVEIDGNGNYKSTHGWFDPSVGGEIIDFVHSYNRKVIITITNFSSSDHELLLKNQDNFNNAIKNIVDAVVTTGADGVNIDFEGLPYSVKGEFVSFISTLNSKLKSVNSQYHLSLAMPKVDWKGSYDYDMLALNSDGLMIMAYGYHYKYGDPGPLCPLYSSSKWGKYSLEWTVNDYFKYGGEENKHKFIIGLPFYGYDWLTTDDKIPGTKVSGTKASLVLYPQFLYLISKYGKLWDEESLSPYVVYKKDGNFHQVFAEDSDSFEEKLKFISQKQLGGIGIWALGYEECSGNDCSYQTDGGKIWDKISSFKSSGSPPPDDVKDTIDYEVQDTKDTYYNDYNEKDSVNHKDSVETNSESDIQSDSDKNETDLSHASDLKSDFKKDSFEDLKKNNSQTGCCNQSSSSCNTPEKEEKCSCDSGCSFQGVNIRVSLPSLISVLFLYVLFFVYLKRKNQ